ncbi:hypothetical protein M1N19_02620 [Dehalococcoidia bacterium]|nr:hypothetical protein [Dehalococcoidia bacterium]
MALCRFSHPNADYAQPILSDEKWKGYFEEVVTNLQH